MSALKDETGSRFDRLVVVARGENIKGQATWLCRCDCGNSALVRGSSLRNGKTRSCGCLIIESAASISERFNVTHGKRYHPLYALWTSMLQRCLNPNAHGYANYGGRGITVCERWRHGESGETGFDCFLADVGDRPSRAHTIDRINPDLGYQPGNCRWADWKQQGLGRRNVRKVTYRGKVMSLPDACEAAGVPYGTAKNRLLRGLSITDALRGEVRHG